MNRGEKINPKVLVIAVIAVIAVASVGAYTMMNNGNNDSETIAIQGSTTVTPYMLEVQEVYEKNNNVTLNITGNGSGTGAAAVLNGTADLAMLSRSLKTSETEAGLVPTVIGYDGIMAIVNKDAGVTTLTVSQLEQIFSGDVTNWNQVGGNDKAISVISREEGSGTRDGFESVLKNADSEYSLVSTAISQSSTSAVLTTVDNTTGAIGYVSLGYAEKVKSNTTMLQVDGVDPTVENVKNGTYTIQRSLVLATKGEATGATADLIKWILGTDGQALLVECGFIEVA